MGINAVHLSEAHLVQVYRHLEAAYPEEGCGLLVGHIDADTCHVHAVVPTENAWAHPEERRQRFLIAPEAFVRVEREAAAKGWQVVGSFHSHPDCPPVPSETDRMFAWTGWVVMIVSLRAGRADSARAWVWDEGAHLFAAINLVRTA
ncbi:MAG: M67 family metallopeptidase [Thermoflexales bacterium]|nr:M67 family metallopeptidase [Thermoflexales bacterium]